MRTPIARSLWSGLFASALILLAGCSTAAPPPISISLSPSGAQAIDQSHTVALKAALTNDTSAKGVTWTLSGPGSLTGGGASVTYASPSTAITSPQQATVTATSVADPTKTASVQITVNPYPVLSTQNPPNGTVGVAYSQTIQLTGGTSPFQWSVFNGSIPSGWKVGGSIPDGLTLNPANGQITGTPTAAGTWYFAISVTDADGIFESFPLSLQINPAASTTAANPVPFLNQPLLPTSAAPGTGDLLLHVSGTGFVAGATVNFNGTALQTTFLDSSHLSATIPAADLKTAKTAAITIVNASPGGGASNPVFFQVGSAQSTVTFANATNTPLQVEEPLGLAVADFNQDGTPDLAIAASIKLYTLLGNGDGTFTAASGSPTSIPSPPYDDLPSPYAGPLAVGDFNHSGHPGLAIGMFNSEAVAIFNGNGDGTFATTSAAFVDTKGTPTEALAAVDFNADGNLDLAIANGLNGVSPIALGYSTGAFNIAGQLDQQGAAIAIGDFNNDGKLDAASGLPISLGNGDGTFTVAPTSPGSPAQSISAVVAADFNGDGNLDLAALVGNNTLILLGNGDGTFQPPVTIPVGNTPSALVTGDFNNDGHLDLAIANSGDNTVTLLLGDGTGAFTPAAGSPFAVGKGPSALVTADFNGDGKLDLAVANSTDNTVSILLQQ